MAENPGRWKRAVGWVDDSLTILKTILALLVAVIALLFFFWPNRFPWSPIHADISKVRVEHNVPLTDYMDNGYARVKDTPPAPYQKTSMGNVVAYRLEFGGYGDKDLNIYWSLRKKTGGSVPVPQLLTNDYRNDHVAWPVEHRRFSMRPVQGVSVSSADAADGEMFIPIPHEDGTYFIKIDVWDVGKGVRLASDSTTSFVVKDGLSSSSS